MHSFSTTPLPPSSLSEKRKLLYRSHRTPSASTDLTSSPAAEATARRAPSNAQDAASTPAVEHVVTRDGRPLLCDSAPPSVDCSQGSISSSQDSTGSSSQGSTDSSKHSDSPQSASLVPPASQAASSAVERDKAGAAPVTLDQLFAFVRKYFESGCEEVPPLRNVTPEVHEQFYEELEDRDPRLYQKLRYNYDPYTQDLVLKMPERSDDSFAEGLQEIILLKANELVRGAPKPSGRTLPPLRGGTRELTTTWKGKKMPRYPDGSIGIRNCVMPPFLIEVANSQTAADLALAVHRWRQCTHGYIKAILTVKMEYWDPAWRQKIHEECEEQGSARPIRQCHYNYFAEDATTKTFASKYTTDCQFSPATDQTPDNDVAFQVDLGLLFFNALKDEDVLPIKGHDGNLSVSVTFGEMREIWEETEQAQADMDEFLRKMEQRGASSTSSSLETPTEHTSEAFRRLKESEDIEHAGSVDTSMDQVSDSSDGTYEDVPSHTASTGLRRRNATGATPSTTTPTVPHRRSPRLASN